MVHTRRVCSIWSRWRCDEMADQSSSDQNPSKTPFEPTILAFCCRHCAYAAADLAGGMRIQYPSNVRIVEVPCSGRVEVTEVLHAFERGVDGVMVAG